jgi:hypothetical protein
MPCEVTQRHKLGKSYSYRDLEVTQEVTPPLTRAAPTPISTPGPNPEERAREIAPRIATQLSDTGCYPTRRPTAVATRKCR